MEAALYLIPVTLGATPYETVLPTYNREVILQIHHFIVEEERSARRFLKMVDASIDIDQLCFYPMGKHADGNSFHTYLQPLMKGVPMGVISEAGCPAVADPGADVVSIAQQMGLKVKPLVGPSSILMGLMSSGFNGQSFAFHGYLPIGSPQRMAMLKKLDARSYAEDQTQIFIETPFRNRQMFDNLLACCRPQTRLCVAAGITCQDEYIRTHTIQEWKQIQLPDLRKTPALFLIYRASAVPTVQKHRR